MRSLPIIVVFSFLFAGSTHSQTQTPSDQPTSEQASALRSDTRWLHLVDSADYPGAWNNAAKIMQNAAPKPEFAKAISDARTPLGALLSRTLAKVQTTKHLPGAPDGLYVVAQYSAHFINKANAVETVVASEEPDGSWHVSGYFIR